MRVIVGAGPVGAVTYLPAAAHGDPLNLARGLVRLGLFAVGLFVILWSVALLGIADCSAACIERGERAPVFGMIGVGVALVTVGGMLARGRRRAIGVALLTGALVTAAGTTWVAFAAGLTAFTGWTLAGAAIAGGVGSWLARTALPARAS